MTRVLALIGLCGLIAAVGCSSDGSNGTGGTGGSPARDYSASIVRTTYGIPHVTADDFGSLGYGAGYAYAQDNFCVLMKEIVRSNGQTARYFGEDEGNLNQDYVYTFFNDDDFIRNEFIGALDQQFQDAMLGYAAGLNRYLEETGVDSLAEGAEGCRGAGWVRPITDLDLGKVYHKLLVRAGISAVNGLIMAADDVAPTQSLASVSPLIESSPFDVAALNLPDPSAIGSNAYGIGANGSQTEHGILLGNPHFPWQGPERWYVQHLTVPGEYDVMGAALQGVPLILLGFNENLAWSHTVSTAQRFSFFELDLVDGNPYQYHYDDEVRDIETNPVTIEVLLEDGTIEERTQNIYMSHFGPIVDLGGLSELAGGWPTFADTVFAVRDANIDNTRIFDQFLEMGTSNSIDELEEALKHVALPWINTIAADRAGTGYYADVSTVPNVSQDKLVRCADTVLTRAVTDQGVASLNGSRSDCEWEDVDGPTGLLSFENLPKIRTGEGVPYVSNSNDSYWLSSPNMLLEGFSPLMGRNGFDPQERIQQSLRTRQGFIQAEERIAGADGLGDPGFTIDLLRDIMFGSRNIAGEMTLGDILPICDAVTDWTEGSCGDEGVAYSANPTEAAQACTILADWDGLFNTDSVGPALWRNVWFGMSNTPNLWAVPFDADDPVGTPNTLNVDDPAVVEAVRCALGGGVDFLVDNGIPLDRPWGEVQFRWNGDRSEQIPVHGGSSGFMWSVISSDFVEGEGYSSITHGNSYIQTVTWDESECPVAYAVLTYSQSTDPASPHYSDWTESFSGKGWNDMPFCPEDIEAEKISEMQVSTN